MRDVELYRSLLGLTAPWTVVDVEVDMKGQRVVVRVDVGPGPYPCPGAVELLRISWEEGWGIKARAVKRGLARRRAEVVARLGSMRKPWQSGIAI